MKSNYFHKTFKHLVNFQNYSLDSQPVATEEIEKETHDNIHTEENREVPTGSLITQIQRKKTKSHCSFTDVH